MATLPFVEEGKTNQEVTQLYAEIKAGFGAGHVPNVYKVLANNPRILEATVKHRQRIMGEGELDVTVKEWLAWATVTLANNAFGVQTHTARLKKLGVSSAEIIEALAVLQYFAGISTVINGLAMADDVDPHVLRHLRQDP